jgi:hypothetical protein
VVVEDAPRRRLHERDAPLVVHGWVSRVDGRR